MNMSSCNYDDLKQLVVNHKDYLKIYNRCRYDGEINIDFIDSRYLGERKEFQESGESELIRVRSNLERYAKKLKVCHGEFNYIDLKKLEIEFENYAENLQKICNLRSDEHESKNKIDYYNDIEEMFIDKLDRFLRDYFENEPLGKTLENFLKDVKSNKKNIYNLIIKIFDSSEDIYYYNEIKDSFIQKFRKIEGKIND